MTRIPLDLLEKVCNALEIDPNTCIMRPIYEDTPERERLADWQIQEMRWKKKP